MADDHIWIRITKIQRTVNLILPPASLWRYFSFFPEKTLDTINCKTTFEGTYHMTYEVNYGGGGICDNPRSTIVACQEPGSVYVDNQVFNMYFGKCPQVSSSVNESGSQIYCLCAHFILFIF
jgi:hypothetical protein